MDFEIAAEKPHDHDAIHISIYATKYIIISLYSYSYKLLSQLIHCSSVTHHHKKRGCLHKASPFARHLSRTLLLLTTPISVTALALAGRAIHRLPGGGHTSVIPKPNSGNRTYIP